VLDLLICVRLLHFTSTLVLTGVLCFRYAIAAPPFSLCEEDASARLLAYHNHLLRIGAASLIVALVFGMGWLGLLAADASGAGLAVVMSPQIVWTFLAQTTLGTVFAVRGLAGFLLLILLFSSSIGSADSVAALLLRALVLTSGTIFVAGLAWSGHAAATEGASGWVHRVNDAIHVLAAGAWVGGLLPLALLLSTMRLSADSATMAIARAVIMRFSMLGVISVAALLFTGALNTWYLAGTLPALLGTIYGRLLLIKIALFAAMLGLASYNRFRLTPRIVEPSSTAESHASIAVSQLVRTSLMEIMLGLGAVALVAWLGALPPAIHDEVWWPLSFRFVSIAYFDPDLRTQTVFATLFTTLGMLMIAAALASRRRNWSLPVGIAGLAIAAFFVRNLDVLTTDAYPTTFQAAPVGYTPQTIASGQSLFASHCALCHGLSGQGDGPAAARSTVPPADLTADHLYGHTDGDLFWVLTVGLGDAMPAFGTALSADDRWRLASFLHANADGERLASLRGRVTFAAFPNPQFAVQCPDGTTRNADSFSGQPVHLIAAGANSAARLDQLAALAKAGTATTIVVPLGTGPDRRFCTASSRALNTVLALYRRADEEALDGTEFLIDSEWRLRAMWHAGFGINWIDPVIFRRQIAEMANPQVLPANLKALNPEFGDTPLKYFPGVDDGRAYHSHRH
jgi:putative copper export protein/mono/diheme cytochrome c family protein